MPSTYTSNYRLNQWEPGDKVLRTDFNADNAKIDAALAGKAEVSALEALSKTVDAKADKSALDSLKSTVSSHTSSLSRKGNCTICFDTYTGTGKYGSSGSTTCTFPGKPLFVVFCDGRSTIMAVNGAGVVFNRDGTGSDALTASWSSRSVSLNSISNAGSQMNVQGREYTVLALIAED